MRLLSRTSTLTLSALALTALSSGCNSAELDQLPATNSEIHYQGGDPPPVDVLFVVDNSGSMEQEQTKLAANFATFIQYFIDLELDFQLAVVTTDFGARGLPVIQCAPKAPATRMSAAELLALERETQTEEDLKRAGLAL